MPRPRHPNTDEPSPPLIRWSVQEIDAARLLSHLSKSSRIGFMTDPYGDDPIIPLPDRQP